MRGIMRKNGVRIFVKRMKVEQARQIAEQAHAGQFRRDGVTPYVTHPERVARRVAGDPDAEAVAWLHDVLEDTDETEEALLAAGVTQHIIDAVTVMTKAPSIDYDAYLARIKSNPLACKVKVQDMLDNLSDAPTERQIVKYARGLLFLLEDKAREKRR